MFCSECGKELAEDVKVCPYCGAPITNEATGNSKWKKVFSKEKMNIPAIISCGIVLISMQFSFYKMSLFGTPIPMALAGSPDGTIISIIAILGLLSALFGINIATIILGVIEIILVFIKYKNGVTNPLFMSFGLGFYLYAIASIAIIITGIIGKIKTRKKK